MVRVSYAVCAICIFEIVLWTALFYQPDGCIRSYVNGETSRLAHAQPGAPHSATPLRTPADRWAARLVWDEQSTALFHTQHALLSLKQGGSNRLKRPLSELRQSTAHASSLASRAAFVIPPSLQLRLAAPAATAPLVDVDC